jgi:hypothetical protein
MMAVLLDSAGSLQIAERFSELRRARWRTSGARRDARTSVLIIAGMAAANGPSHTLGAVMERKNEAP